MPVIFKHDYMDGFVSIPAGTRVEVTWFDEKKISFIIDCDLGYKIEFERADQSIVDGFNWRDYAHEVSSKTFKWLKEIGATEMELDGVKVFSIHDPDLHDEIEYAPEEIYDLYDSLADSSMTDYYFTAKGKKK